MTPTCALALGRAFEAQGTQLFFLEVQYQSEFPEVNWYKSTTYENLKAILGMKALAWKHEAEWRIALSNRTGYLKIPTAIITGIVFACALDPAIEQQVRGWVRERGGGIELLRVTNKPGSFELQLEPA